MKIRKGDTIKILSGKDRGKTAKVLYVNAKAATLLAEGINLKKKHVRSRQQGKRGEIVAIPAPFAASNAMIICASCGQPARAGARFETGRKIRVCKKCGEKI